jgi:hypothetical protein
MTVFIAGNSHVGELVGGNAAVGVDATIFSFGSARHETDVFSERRGDAVGFLVEEYETAVRKNTSRDVIAAGTRWGFLQVNHNVRIYRHGTWLTYEPAAIARPGTIPVSHAALVAMIERDQRGVRRFFEQLKAAGVDFFAISAPPPRSDHRAIKRGVRPETILHIDRVAREVWSAFLADLGVETVQPPAESWTDEGFLDPRFNHHLAHDRHHANDDYGALMMARIAEHLRGA